MKLNHTLLLSACLIIAALCLAAPADARLTGVVSGQVIDADGNGIKGVEVILRSLDGSNPHRTTKSSKSGRYRFAAVIPGKYIVIASDEEYDHKNQQVIRVSSNGKIKLDILMDEAENDPGDSGDTPSNDTESDKDASTHSDGSLHSGGSGGNNSVHHGSESGNAPSEVQRP